MELFYTTQIDYPHLYLQNEEAIHCIKSLRKNIHDNVHATDGAGNSYYGHITHIDKKNNIVTVRIENQECKQKMQNLGLCIAPTKNIDRMEWLVEKATELGISEIQWIVTQHSQRKNISTERMHRIAVAAMKQSLQYFLPKICDIQNFSEWLQKHRQIQGIIGYCGDMEKKPVHIVQKPLVSDIFWICIGPEGDFTQNEVEQALNVGLTTVSIGTHRLRTETAALTALAYFYL
jgi:16S rRNA (uracil1498-N3)-methyltransferase